MKSVKNFTPPVDKEEKLVRSFHWIPLSIYNPETNVEETRWLEFATVRYVFHKRTKINEAGWYPIEFISE